MSAPVSRDPLTVITQDGNSWVRRAVTQDGHGLYALGGTPRCCPEYVLASLRDLAELGLRSMSDALPVGAERSPLDRALDDLTGANLSLWEEEQTTARLRLALESAQRGRRGLRARVAELELERHSTNEALSDAAEALRANRDRVAELETRPTLADVVAYLDKKAREYRSTGSPQHELQARAVETVASKIARGAVRPVAVEKSPDRLTATYAPVAALREDPHDSPLHHRYELGRDLPETGGGTC